MPEGDTIHKLASYLRSRLEGQRLRSGRLRDHPEVILTGRRVESVRAHGKHLFIEFESHSLLRTHLGMYGSWHRYSPGEPWQRPTRQASLELEVDQHVLVCFNAREAELLRSNGVRTRELEARLGPDLVSNCDVDEVLRRARRLLPPEAMLVDVLLDQRVAAGLGNVYKSELLFIEKLPPYQQLRDTSDAALGRIYALGSELLRKNLGGGPRITRFPQKLSNQARHLWVYRRAGLPCYECGSRVLSAGRVSRETNSAELASGVPGSHVRSTYWCPTCQESGPPGQTPK